MDIFLICIVYSKQNLHLPLGHSAFNILFNYSLYLSVMPQYRSNNFPSCRLDLYPYFSINFQILSHLNPSKESIQNNLKYYSLTKIRITYFQSTKNSLSTFIEATKKPLKIIQNNYTLRIKQILQGALVRASKSGQRCGLGNLRKVYFIAMIRVSLHIQIAVRHITLPC